MSARAPRLTGVRAALVTALLACAVYANAPANDFAYDDVPIIARDTMVHSLRHVPELFGRNYWSGDTVLALYRPLTTASFALDWTVSDGNPAYFHAVNVAWHALATALATLLLAALLGSVAALAGGALFAVHPVHVEAVANVVGRAELIAAAATFAAALVWLRPRSLARDLAAAALFAAGLLAKESVLALPLLLLLVDAARGRLPGARLRDYVSERARSYALLALVALGYLVLRHAVLGGLAPTRVDPALEVASGNLARVLTALQAWPHVLRLLLFPNLLLADYGPRIIMPAPGLTGVVLFGAVLLASALLGGALALRLRAGRAALLLLWVPLALLPVSNLFLPIGVVVAERLLYIPSFAVAAAVGALASALWRHPAAPARGLAAAALTAALALGAARTWQRTPVWRSTDHVMVAQLVDRPDSFRAHWHRARTLRAAGRHEEALMAYRMAVGLWPFRPGLTRETAAYEAQRGELGRARELARFGVRRWPQEVAWQRLLAATSLDLADTATARTAIRAGLALDSTDAVLRRMRAALDTGSNGPR